MNISIYSTEPSPRQKGKRKLDYHEKKDHYKLPLSGKTLYLDVKDVRQTRQLEADLKTLGAVCINFLLGQIKIKTLDLWPLLYSLVK